MKKCIILMAISLLIISCSDSSQYSLYQKAQQMSFKYENDMIIMGEKDTLKIIDGKVYNRVQKEPSELVMIMYTDKDTIIQNVGELHLIRSIRKIRKGTTWDRMIKQMDPTNNDTLLFVSELLRIDRCEKDREDMISAFVYDRNYRVLYFFKNEIVVYE